MTYSPLINVFVKVSEPSYPGEVEHGNKIGIHFLLGFDRPSRYGITIASRARTYLAVDIGRWMNPIN
jgi:hypothetical protein